MAENAYEGMFILDSNHYGRDPAGVSGQIDEVIKKAGGTILVSRLWEERRLAYPIKRHRKGTYWLTYFRLEATELAGIERQCRLSDSILRVLFLKVDPRIVDAIVTHAQGGSADTTDTGKAEAVGEGDKKAVAKDEAVAAVDQSESEPSGTEDAGE